MTDKSQLQQIMQQAQKMQAKMQEIQQEIANMIVEGVSGGGLVRAKVTGKYEAKTISIDPSLLSGDKEVLEDLIAAAFNDAVRKIESETKTKMGSLAAGLNLPGGLGG